jgi:predicted dehydrogenase
MASVEAGKHIYSEKPICVHLEEAQELLRRAADNNRVV